MTEKLCCIIKSILYKMTPSLIFFFFSGVDLSADKIADLLSKMSLPSKALDGNRVEVEVGPTRHDILHPCDIMEVIVV